MEMKKEQAKRYVIVGGVAGGATAAARLRRLDKEAKIVLFERGEHISFANCGLPYYVGDEIKESERLLLMTPELFRERFAVDVRTGSEVTHVDSENRRVHVRTAAGETYEEPYDALLLSPGAKPLRPPIPGVESPRILSLRNVPDAEVLRRLADQYAAAGRTVVVGGGFIGVEMAENLRARGLSVTLVEAAPHVLAPFDADMAKIAEKEMNENGVGLYLGDGVQEFKEDTQGVRVRLVSGREIAADFVVLAIGVSPDTDFLKDSSVALGARGHILVNEHMETSVPDVYAVGDAVMTFDRQTNTAGALPLAGPANRQGRLAADNMTGRRRIYDGFIGTAILKVFGLTAAAVGKNERMLEREGLRCGEDYRVVKLHPLAHVGYYPGAQTMTLKLLYRTKGAVGKILGAQIVGTGGVKSRIDVLATAIAMGADTDFLTSLELSYAPPFGAAKDPVNMAGYMAENDLAGLVRFLPAEQLDAARQAGVRVLDVRTPGELSHAPFASDAQIPLDELRTRVRELDRTVRWAVLCKVGQRAYNAARILAQDGYDAEVIAGGYTSLKMAEFEASPDTAPPCGAAESMGCGGTPRAAKMAAAAEEVDLTGLSCPGPLMELQKAMERIASGDVLLARASDPGFFADSAAWAEAAGHRMISRSKENGLVVVKIKKAGGKDAADDASEGG